MKTDRNFNVFFEKSNFVINYIKNSKTEIFLRSSKSKKF